MSRKKSTMSPKRLFILLTLAGILMWLFSKSTVEVDVSIDTSPNQKEELQSEKLENKEFEDKEFEEKKVTSKAKNKKRIKQKEKENKENDYLKKRDLDYDPSTRNN